MVSFRSLNMVTDGAKPSLLLVEDEQSLLALLQRYLERLEYRILTAETGAEALRLAEESQLDVVVLDLGLPDMPGIEVLARILESSSRTRVLVSSGTPFSTETLPEPWQERTAFLQKPYLPKALVEAVDSLASGLS